MKLGASSIISAGRKAVRPLRGAAGPGRSRADVMQQAQRAASTAQAPPLAGRIGPRANSLRLLYHISGPQSGSPAAGAAGPGRSRAEVMQQAQRAASAAQAPPLAGWIGPRGNSLRLLHHISGPQSGPPAAGRSGARPQPGGCDATGAARGVRRAGPASGGVDWAEGQFTAVIISQKPLFYNRFLCDRLVNEP